MDKELFDLNDEFGSEIKKSFEEEFDINDISVSDDLIARTMAAINLKADNTDTDIDTASVEKVTDITRKRSSLVWKWASGIAAAMFLGVVIFLVVKIGKGSYKEQSASNSIAFDATADINSESITKEDCDEPAYYSTNEVNSASASAGAYSDSAVNNIDSMDPIDNDSYLKSNLETKDADFRIDYNNGLSLGREYGKTESSDNNSFGDFTQKNSEKTDDAVTDSDLSDEDEDMPLLSEEAIENRLGYFFDLIVNDEEKETGEKTEYEKLLEEMHSSQLYSYMIKDKENSIEKLKKILSKREDETEKEFIRILIADLEADTE